MTDPWQHRDCLENPNWIPAWYDLPEGADPRSHNPFLIIDSSTKQTAMDIFQARVGIDEVNRRIAELRERFRDLPESPGTLGRLRDL